MIHLHLPDGRLDGTAPIDHRLQASHDASLLARTQDAHSFYLYAPIAFVHDRRRRLALGKDGVSTPI